MSAHEAKRGNEIAGVGVTQHAAARISMPSTRDVVVQSGRPQATPAANAPARAVGAGVRLNGHKMTCECEHCAGYPVSPGAGSGVAIPPVVAPVQPPVTPEERLARERVSAVRAAMPAAGAVPRPAVRAPNPQKDELAADPQKDELAADARDALARASRRAAASAMTDAEELAAFADELSSTEPPPPADTDDETKAPLSAAEKDRTP
jgi:hypothetical protein